jgi:hypothetical protein
MAEQSNGVPEAWNKKWSSLGRVPYKDGRARILIVARSFSPPVGRIHFCRLIPASKWRSTGQVEHHRTTGMEEEVLKLHPFE